VTNGAARAARTWRPTAGNVQDGSGAMECEVGRSRSASRIEATATRTATRSRNLLAAHDARYGRSIETRWHLRHVVARQAAGWEDAASGSTSCKHLSAPADGSSTGHDNGLQR